MAGAAGTAGVAGVAGAAGVAGVAGTAGVGAIHLESPVHFSRLNSAQKVNISSKISLVSRHFSLFRVVFKQKSEYYPLKSAFEPSLFTFSSRFQTKK